ncbi:MAG TPA: ScyD/ScyE family protein [Opitutus sp.]|nr:ScyD/ScyE family protein [Opitutus sp.]
MNLHRSPRSSSNSGACLARVAHAFLSATVAPAFAFVSPCSSRTSRRIAIGAGCALLFAGSASAQFASRTIVGNLDNPRGLAFGADGALYIAEAGRVETPGADTPSITVRGMSLYYGETGAITRWEPGETSNVLSNLPSLYNPVSGEVTGVHGIGFGASGDLYFTTGLGADPAVRTGPELNRLGHLMRLPAGGSAAESVADVSSYEGANNPAGGPLDSNPFHLAVHSGGVLVADAGANAILNVNFDGSFDLVSTLTAVPPGIDAVPTSLALSETGELYISQLTGFPFPVGGAGVFRVDEAGLSLVGGGFTNVIDLTYGPDGMLYVLEFAHFGLLSGDPTGGLWRVDPATGLSKLLMTEGLIAPTALTFDRFGNLYIANRGVMPGAGEVLQFHPVPEPAVTGLAAAAGLAAFLFWKRRKHCAIARGEAVAIAR